MTYEEAENKIIQAYFRDEIKPFDANFCFCGTIHGGAGWSTHLQRNIGYTAVHYNRMEAALFKGMEEEDGPNWSKVDFVNSEDAIFNGMCKALDVLKQIHIDRGENIEPVPFKKRELVS